MTILDSVFCWVLRGTASPKPVVVSGSTVATDCGVKMAGSSEPAVNRGPKFLDEAVASAKASALAEAEAEAVASAKASALAEAEALAWTDTVMAFGLVSAALLEVGELKLPPTGGVVFLMRGVGVAFSMVAFWAVVRTGVVSFGGVDCSGVVCFAVVTFGVVCFRVVIFGVVCFGVVAFIVVAFIVVRF